MHFYGLKTQVESRQLYCNNKKFIHEKSHQPETKFDSEIFTYNNVYNEETCGLPAEITFFKNTIFVKDGKRFKENFLGEGYPTEKTGPK